MEWHYVQAGQRVGPVADTQLDELVRTGRITPDTLVWNATMTEWQPYSATHQGAPGLPPPIAKSADAATVQAVCAECGNSFNREEMMPYQNSYVCAKCKPIFLQRLREGAAPAADRGLWRKGKDLVVPLGAELPSRCAKCAQPVSNAPVRRKLYWHSPWLYLLILVNLLVYAIVAVLVRKKAVINVPVCPEHRKRRAQILAASWLMILLSIGLWILAANVTNNGGVLVLVGLLLFLTGIILGIAKGTLVRAMRIDDRFVFVRGFSPPFLAPLPEWHGPNGTVRRRSL